MTFNSTKISITEAGISQSVDDELFDQFGVTATLCAVNETSEVATDSQMYVDGSMVYTCLSPSVIGSRLSHINVNDFQLDILLR